MGAVVVTHPTYMLCSSGYRFQACGEVEAATGDAISVYQVNP